MLQTVLQQESREHSSSELNRYADQLETTASHGNLESTSGRVLALKTPRNIEEMSLQIT